MNSCRILMKEVAEVAEASGLPPEELKRRAHELHESNPMLGHRGCRLGITYPEIYEMQARAIFEAALEVVKETGEEVMPEIMIPLVATRIELERLKARIDAVADDVAKKRRPKPKYLVGTMIELPRAALHAGEIAGEAEFFSFGTNDLTQTTFGISRDDAGSFLDEYVAKGILPRDPFVTLDQEGVGELVQIAAERGRKTRPESEARHLRRAWRRSGIDRVLRRGRARLRLLLALPRADRAPRRRPSRAEAQGLIFRRPDQSSIGRHLK